MPIQSPLPRLAAVSHRTHAGTHPENTLLGIQAALDDVVEAIEVDVRRTRDGVLLLMHDETLERTTGDPRRVDATDYAEIQALRVRPRTAEQEPQPIPTLDEALALIDGRAAVVLDFVEDALADELIEAVRKTGAAPWTWWTVHTPRLAERLAEATPGSRSFLGWTPNDQIFHSPIEALDACVRRGLAGLNANHRYIDETVVRYAHREELSVGVWTVNDPKRMAALVRLGVDAITTDFPATLHEVRRRVMLENGDS